ncbi:hypothetical protein CLOM_g22087 [Closterium sp. NIES-68]|nr:hypothetical protein CLOM_g22087 [Closterium sp. NIES-68]
MDRDLPEKRVTRASSKRAAASCSQNLAPPGGDVGPNLASPTDMRNNSERVERSCSNKYGTNVFFLDGKQRVVEFTVSTTVGDVLNGVASTVSVEKFPTLALYLQRYRAPDARDALSTSDYVRIDEKTLMADVVTDVAGVRQRSNGRVRARLLFHQKFSGVTDGTMTDFVFLYLTYTHMEQLRQQAFVGRDELMGVVQQTWKVEERLQAAVKEKEALLERSKEETARVQSELKALQESTAAERSALEAKVRQEEELRKTETQVAASERQAWEARLGDLEHAKAEEVEQLQRRAGAEMRGQADALEQSQQVVAQLQEQVRQSEGLLERSSEQTSEARSAVERSAAESRRLAEALKQSQLVVAQLDAQLKMKDAHLEQQTRAWEQERSEAAAEIARAVSRALVEKVGDVEAQHGALESALAAKEAVWADDRRAFLESIERLQRQEVEAKHLQGQAEAGQEQALQERSRVQSEVRFSPLRYGGGAATGEEREKAEAGLQEALKEKEQQLERSVEEASRVRSEVERLQQQASASGNYLMEVVQQSWEVEERLQAAVREKEVLQNRSQEDTARAQSERQGLRQHADALTTRVEESRRVEAQLRQELANEKQLRGGAEEREAQLKGAVEKEAVLRREAEERETQLKGAVEKEMVLRREAEERETQLKGAVEKEMVLRREAEERETQLKGAVEKEAVLRREAEERETQLKGAVEKEMVLRREAEERETQLRAVEKEMVLRREAEERETQLKGAVEKEMVLRREAEEREAQLKGAVEKEAVLRREAEERETQLKGAVEKEMVLRREAEERETQLKGAVEKEAVLRREAEERETQLKGAVEKEMVLRREAEERETQLKGAVEKEMVLRREAEERETQLKGAVEKEAVLRREAEERETQLKGAVEKEMVLRREAEERETQLKGAVEKEMVLRREAEERETTLQEELSGKEVQLRSEVEGKAVLLAAASAAQRELEELREKLSKLQREALERTRAAEEAGQKWEVKRLEVELENVRKLDEVQKELSNTRRELSNARGEALEQAGAAGKEKEALLEELWGLRLKMKSKELAVAKETAEARAAEGMAAGAVVASLERAVKEAERLEVELKASKSLAAQYKADKEELERVLQQERASAAKAEELRGQLREATCSAEALATRGMAEATLREELEEKEADLQKFRKQVEELRASEKRLDVKVKDLEKQYNEEVSKRRKLQDSMGSIRGIVRCRPLSAEEESTGHMPVVTCSDKFTVEHSGKDGELKSHPFYRVYDPTATQANVFESVEDLVEASLDGFNACILAYGQTGSGKTYTMCGNEAQPGLIPLAVRKIFNSRDKSPAHVTIEVQVCMLELYLKDVLDLLDPKDPKNPAGISVTGKRQVNLKNVTLFPVESASRLEQLIQEGIGRRQVDGTEMNAASSRSHMLLSIVIKTYNNLTKRTHTGKLSFVDLAGSESLKASGAQGKLVTETTHINSGLSFLNLVILALKNGYSHIPYGNDNLTRVLADSLGGNSKTLMIVNISPSNKYLEETEKSLSYGVLAQCIINTASRNVGATKK